MCFSATASFTVTGLLSATAVLTFAKLKQISTYEGGREMCSSYFLLALYPVLFAIQQCIEGLNWINSNDGQNPLINKILGGLFLFFVFVVWTNITPAATYALERNPLRKKLIKVTMIAGILVGIYFVINFFMHPVRVYPLNHSMYYEFYNWPYRILFSSLYVLATCVPFLLCTKMMMKLIGFFLIISFILTLIFAYHFFLSIWCFFGTIISFMIYADIHRAARYLKKNQN